MRRFGLVFAAMLLASASAQSQVYRCDLDGKMTFQDKPCPDGQSQSEMELDIQKPSWEREREREKAEREKLIESLSPKDRAHVKAGKVYAGMPASVAELSWGFLERINRQSNGPDQWVFNHGNNTRYLYVQDGRVVSWQETEDVPYRGY